MYKRYMLIKPACSKGCAVGRVFEAVQKQYFQDEQKNLFECEVCGEEINLKTGVHTVVVEKETEESFYGYLRSHVIELPGEETIEEIEETLELEK